MAHNSASSEVELALAAHAAATGFVGAPVGVMDQMVCGLGAPGEALLLDTHLLEFEKVALPPDLGLLGVRARSGSSGGACTGQ